jgi:hypothetical protein
MSYEISTIHPTSKWFSLQPTLISPRIIRENPRLKIVVQACNCGFQDQDILADCEFVCNLGSTIRQEHVYGNQSLPRLPVADP